MEDLQSLLSNKTKIVALPHVSNLLGEVLDMAAVVKAVRNSPAGKVAVQCGIWNKLLDLQSAAL